MTPDPRARFMQAFSFSVEDLAANRQGQLSVRQQQTIAQHIRMARTSSFIALIVTLVSLVIVFGVPIFVSQDPSLKQAVPYLAGTAMAVLGMVGIFAVIGVRRLGPLQRQEVRYLEGTVHLTTRRFGHGRWVGYYAQIGRTRFQLTSKKQFESLSDGSGYRIHHIFYPPTHIILSVEEI